MGDTDSVDIRQASGTGVQARAATAPTPGPVSAADNPLPAPPSDPTAETPGRRTLSKAFVMIGPDGLLTVELRGGRVLILRDVVLRAKDYCGTPVTGNPASARYCGGYAEVADARPGGAPAPDQPDLAAPDPLSRTRSR